MHRAPRILLGLTLSGALLAFGLFITGTRIRAQAAAPGPTGLAPLDGSTATHGTVLIDGQPTRVSECTSLSAPGMVLMRYEEQAAAESGRREAPYLLQTDPGGGGALLWTAADGTRRAVLASPSASGSRYRLIEAPPPARDARSALPDGLAPPPGAQVVFSVERPGGGGFAMLRLPTSPAVAADRCLTALAARGVEADPVARALLSSSPEGSITLPLVDASGPRGVLVVAADEGGARASLTLE